MSDHELDALPAGSTLRFRVTDDERRVQSATWNVVGSRNSGDLYFGGREFIGEFKLSAHASGITRMGWTRPAATARLEPGAERALSRWEHDGEVSPGWRVAFRLTIPDSELTSPAPPAARTRARPILELPSAGRGRAVIVRALLGTPHSGPLTVDGELEEVGRMMLGDGSKVWVLAFSAPVGPDLQEMIDRAKQAVLAQAESRAAPRAFAWGEENETGVPSIIDLGDPRPGRDSGAERSRPGVDAHVWIGPLES